METGSYLTQPASQGESLAAPRAQSSRALQFNVGTMAQPMPAAIAVYELAEVLESPLAQAVPFAPSHCREFVVWQGHVVPVFDLMRYVAGADATAGVVRHVLVAAYQLAPGTPLAYLGIRVVGLPQTIQVADADMVDLPPGQWRPIASSCYSDGLDAIPVLSVQALAALGG
jgi:chemotaxis signal transduction protein